MIKKLETKEKKVKKEKRNQLILAGILVAVMLTSIFGIVFSYNAGNTIPTREIIFNGNVFTDQGGYYAINVSNSILYFSNNPNNLASLGEDINLSKKISNYFEQPVYIVSNDYPSYNEIVQDFTPYVLRVQGACIEGENCSDSTLPIKTCADNVIVVKEAEKNRIYENQNCVYIEGKSEDLLRLTDDFLLRVFGFK